MEKTVIVINGAGGAGKDTLCGITARHYDAVSVSSITPVKEIARRAGWNGVKNPKSRKLLSDLKRIFTEYNDLPGLYLSEEYAKFMNGPHELMFVHIREPREIEKFLSAVHCRKFTLLVKRNGGAGRPMGNDSDDGVEGYAYDRVYINNEPMDLLENSFMSFLRDMLGESD